MTLAGVAVPAAYTIFPSLATDPGFWRTHRLVVCLVAVVVTLSATCVLEIRRLRATRELERQYGQATARAERAATELSEAAQAQRRMAKSLTAVRDEIAIGSSQWDLVRASAESFARRNPIAPLASLPPDATELVLVRGRRGLRAAVPLSHADLLEPSDESMRFTNVFRLQQALSEGKPRVVRVRPGLAEHLPLGMRATTAAVVVPIPGPLGDFVGVGCILFRSPDTLDDPSFNDYVSRCLNWINDIKLIVNRLHEVLMRVEDAVVTPEVDA